MKLGSKALGIILVVILFGGITLSTALGYWQTKSTKQPIRFQEGEAAGEYNPADIRGSYTFGEISPILGSSRSHYHNATFVTLLVGSREPTDA